MYLFDNSPIVVNTTLANEIGLNEAIVLQQINYWIEINKRAGKNYYDGKYWTYNSIKSWHENNFKFLSVETVRRVFTKLEKSGFIITGNYNKDPRDKTKWYTINDKKLEELYFEVEDRKKKLENEKLKENGFEAIPNAFSQNDQMQLCEMNKPLPENTTENNNQSICEEMIDERDREDYLEKLRTNTDYYKILEECEFKAKMKKIKNIRSYILTTVFNAPFTMSSYYNNQVNCDLNDDE